MGDVNHLTVQQKKNDNLENKRAWEKTADKYIKNCHKFEITIDSSVLIALQTGWTILQPTKTFNEGALLPLMEILEDNNHIKKLNLASSGMHDARFRSGGNGNSNARVLNTILKKNTVIEEVNLSFTGLDDDGIEELCDSLRLNTSIKNLNLSNNHFGETGAEKLRNALLNNRTIKTNGNFVFEEILNSLSHGLAFLASVVGANLLIAQAAETSYTDYHFWACVLYSFSLMFLFLSSTLFHSFFMMPRTSRILQVLDHVGIYLLIAGTYTPFLLIGLHHHAQARVLLTGQWIAALLGSIFATCSDLNSPSTTLIELVIFVCMGFGLVLVWPVITVTLSTIAMRLLLLGGAAYLVGIIFFVLGEYKPIYHTIWHLFVVLGASLHWFDIYFYISNTPLHAGGGSIGHFNAYTECPSGYAYNTSSIAGMCR